MGRLVVTDSDVAAFRAKLLDEIHMVPELYHPKDVEMIKSNYEICRRYVRHKRRDMNNAVEMAKKSLQWRNEFGVNGIAESNIYRLYMNVGCFIPFKKDKQGSQCIIFRTKLHRKSAERSHDMKRYMVFWVEKLLYEQNHPRITFVFDSTGASYSNMDLEQIMFTIQIFNEYYPWALGYVIVYNMPWILKTVWTGIQSLIPAEGSDRFKFCNGNDIFNFIEPDSLPEFMGGTVQVPFRELTSEEIESIPLDSNIEKRIYMTPAIKQFYLVNFGLFANSVEPQTGDRQPIAQIIACRPDGYLSFEGYSGLEKATLELTNCLSDGRAIAFRIRTNRPDGYTAYPHCGTISDGTTVRISVTKLKESDGQTRDKLLVQAIPIDRTQPPTELVDLFKKLNRGQLFEKKILCERLIGDDDTEQDFANSLEDNSHLSLARNANSLERRMAILSARCERQQLFNIVLCALFILNLAITLHSKVCQSRNSWWFC